MPEFLFNNFSQGAISPQWYGRTDLEQYRSAAKELTNFIVLPTGGAQKRPGTLYDGSTKNSGTGSNEGVRLIPFQTTPTAGYACEFGHNYIRFYDSSGLVESGGSAYEVVTTYDGTDVGTLKYVQVADKLYLFHREYAPQVLTYTSATSWAITALSPTADASFSQDLVSADQRPGACTVDDQRLIVASTNNAPGTLWGSVPGDFTDFEVSATAVTSDAIEFTPQSYERLEIEWMIGGSTLLLGTSDGLWSGFGPGTLISGAGDGTLVIRRQSAVGSSDVQGVLVNDYAFFVERGGNRVRQARFQEAVQQFITPAISMPVDHYFEGNSVSELHYQLSPYPVLWAVRETGSPVVFSYSEETGASAWSELDVGGTVVSAAVTKGTNEDTVYISVQREIDGTTETYIEHFDSRIVSNTINCNYVDSGVLTEVGDAVTVTDITLSSGSAVVVTSDSHGLADGSFVKFSGVVGTTELNGDTFEVDNGTTDTFELKNTDGDDYTAYTSGGTSTPVTKTISGLTHLEGETVAVWADGAVQTSEVVDTGAITIDSYANTIYVGLPFTATLETVDIPEAQSKLKTIYNTLLRFYRTIGGKIGKSSDDLTDIAFLDTGFTMGVGPSYFSGIKKAQFQGRPSFEGNIVIVSDQPTPMTLLSVIAELRVEREMQ